jgi:hypothetical protein
VICSNSTLYSNPTESSPTSLLPIPLHRLLKLNPTASKDIQRTANRQINLATAQRLDQFQILQVASTARIRDGNRADGRQQLDELSVNTGLLAFDVRGVDQEFGAVRLEEGDVFWVR